MKKTVLLSLLLACVFPFWSTAQETSPNRKKINITPEQVQSTVAAESSLRSTQTISNLKPLKIKFADPVENFFTLALNWPKTVSGNTDLSFEYREKKRSKWSEWKALPVDRHGEEESSVEATEMKQLDARGKMYSNPGATNRNSSFTGRHPNQLVQSGFASKLWVCFTECKTYPNRACTS